jgi:hypothetical protein
VGKHQERFKDESGWYGEMVEAAIGQLEGHVIGDSKIMVRRCSIAASRITRLKERNRRDLLSNDWRYGGLCARKVAAFATCICSIHSIGIFQRKLFDARATDPAGGDNGHVEPLLYWAPVLIRGPFVL